MQVKPICVLCALITLLSAAPAALADPAWDIYDWHAQRLYLGQEIQRVNDTMPRVGEFQEDVGPYLECLQEAARWRDMAFANGQEAQGSKNPAIRALFEPFMELAEWAQDTGNRRCLDYARDNILCRLCKPYDREVGDTGGECRPMGNWINRMESIKPLYREAVKLSFDRERIRKGVRWRLDDFNGCVQTGDSRVPSILWPSGKVSACVSKNLETLESARVQARDYELGPQLSRIEDFMNDYLIDALCIRERVDCPPPDQSHQWYRDLAQSYRLPKAQRQISGFYGTVFGKVELETPRGNQPAAGARVAATDPRDGTQWAGETKDDGTYDIRGALLHEKCSPFSISATYGPDLDSRSYEGPLREPDASKRHEENFLIHKGDIRVEIKAVFQWKDQGDDVTEGNASLTVSGTMELDKEFQLPNVERYKPAHLTAGWSFTERNFSKASDKCPDLHYEFMGGGATAIPDPRVLQNSYLEIRTFGDLLPKDMPVPIPAEARAQLVDAFDLVLGGAMQPIRYRERRGNYCSATSCPCREYKEIDREIGVGTLLIRSRLAENGEMKGARHWNSDTAGFRTIGFQVNDVGEQPRLRPKPMDKVGSRVMSVSVSWNIQKLKK